VNDTVACTSRRAFAKVNLALRLMGRRPDGYHEVSTVMVPVRLHDLLTFRPGGKGLSVFCPSLPDLLPKDNLVMKAVRAILDASGSEMALEVHVDKAIPAGGGMGGGSSDAAAALLAVNEMLPEEKRLRPGRLLKVAASLGADAPFFLGCNSIPPAWMAAWCTGIGADVHPLPTPKDFHLVLAIPALSVNTAQAYRDWDESGYESAAGGEDKEQAVREALESGDAAVLGRSLVNDMEGPVSQRYPVTALTKHRLLESGALGASMTGSGSAVFGVCRSPQHAEAVKLEMQSCVGELGLTGVMVLRTGCD